MKTSASVASGLLVLLAVVLGGCGGGAAAPPGGPAGEDGPGTPATTGGKSSPPPPGAAAACVLTVVYQGNRYFEWSVEVVPREGGPLGTGIIPDCNDTGGEPGRGEAIELTGLEGVSPEIALLWRGRPEAVLVREGFENELPAELRREAPACDPADEPIRLAGPWFGLFGPRPGDPEDVDLETSYDVKLFAAESSVPRYERAFLVVRVPAGLDRSLTRDDLRWLWDGTIELSVVCRDGRYVAESVAAYPPA